MLALLTAIPANASAAATLAEPVASGVRASGSPKRLSAGRGRRRTLPMGSRLEPLPPKKPSRFPPFLIGGAKWLLLVAFIVGTTAVGFLISLSQIHDVGDALIYTALVVWAPEAGLVLLALLALFVIWTSKWIDWDR
jgi:hypothetical protein